MKWVGALALRYVLSPTDTKNVVPTRHILKLDSRICPMPFELPGTPLPRRWVNNSVQSTFSYGMIGR
jgi:hypothetical protein